MNIFETNEWKTERLLIRNIDGYDCMDLQNILKSVFENSNWGEISLEEYVSDYFVKTMIDPDLPPNYGRESFQIQVILKNKQEKPIGWVEFCCGYPSKYTLWIGALFIDPKYQNMKYGSELISTLIKSVKDNTNYKAIQIGVYLRNWPALHFWYKMGFDNIVRLSGSKNYGNDKNCKVALELIIN